MQNKIIYVAFVILILFAPTIVSAETVTRQLIRNGSFENKSYWDHNDSFWRDKDDAKKGLYYGLLFPDYGDGISLEQTVIIPKKAKSVTVTFWYKFWSTDYPDFSDDFCSFDLESDYFPDGYIGFESWHPGEEETSSWEKHSFTFIPKKKVRGKDVTVSFYCREDGLFRSWLEIDNVKLKVDVEK